MNRLFESALLGVCSWACVASVASRFLGGGWVAGAPAAAIVSLAFLFRKWPSFDEAATLIDSQFGWNELLRSAMASSRQPNKDHLGDAVAAVADARCLAARTTSLRLGRVSSRQTVIAVVILSASAALWVAPHAVARSHSADFSSIRDDFPFAENGIVSSVSMYQKPGGPKGEDEASARRTTVDQPGAHDSSADSARPGRSAAGTGAGAAAAASANVAASTASGPASANKAAGVVASGEGFGAALTNGSRGAMSGIVSAHSQTAATVWTATGPQHGSTDGKASNATSAVDRDRDLIRAYFDR